MANTTPITIASAWASLTDYISADQYNKLVSDIVSVASARGITISATPSTKASGDPVSLADILALQNLTNNTIRYYRASDGTTANSDTTKYPFHSPATVVKPMALLFNEVRQVMVDMYSGAGCVQCSNACRVDCSVTCTTATSESSTSCGATCAQSCSATCVGSCFTTCSNGCGSGCIGMVTGSSPMLTEVKS